MYCKHFGLTQAPFKITPDTRLFYPGSNRGAVLEALIYTVLNGEGIVKVVGEVGSGKTMLCRMLETQLPDTVDVVYLDNPGLMPENILHAIAIEMGLSVTMQDNRYDVIKLLQKHLLAKHENNCQVVVFVEEAQGVPIETLEEIRLLSNLETQRHKLLQIVLFGQPELDENLSVQRIRQLRDRITHRFYLDTLSKQEVEDYLMARLRVVGYQGESLFSSDAITLLTRSSKGLMRRINILADKSLLAAFADSSASINRKHVARAVADSEFDDSVDRKPVLAAAVGVMIAAISIYLYLYDFNKDSSVARSQIGMVDSGKNRIVPSQITNTPQQTVNDAQSVAVVTSPAKTSQKNTSSLNEGMDLISERNLHTRDWLSTADHKHYSIQVLQTRADFKKDLERFLLKQSVEGDIKKLFIYQTRVNGRLVYCVMYDEFETYADALKALEQMSPDLKKNKPFLRSIYQLKEEAIPFDIS